MTINVIFVDTPKAILHTTGNYSAESRIAAGGQQKTFNMERVLIDDVAPYKLTRYFPEIGLRSYKCDNVCARSFL
jgi:hypothetical protein